MKNSLKFLLRSYLKSSEIKKKTSGFTLIELLVAMILAVLVITPLMAFMISILDTDRREQAKATSEQEIQAALDFIARDLEQAVYIYDADGVTRNRNTTDITLSGIRDHIPPVVGTTGCNSTNASNCQPVLVFWKREFIANSVGVSTSTDTGDANTDDGYAYSLVGYYLITNSSAPWSPAARIARFQIRGAVNATNVTSASGANTADSGFSPPPLSANITGATLKERMNQWKNSLAAGSTYTQPVVTLVDFISTTGPAITCPSGAQGIGNSSSGFYACVNAAEVLAQVYIRGNSLVRLNNNNNTPYTPSVATDFPAASIRVQGRGFLYTK
jgi:prepilin-type N-terminal cleavage/methylation domain-containing protein